MRAITILQILLIATFTLAHLQSNAQQTATAVMTVSVEVIAGSTVEMNQNDLITSDETNPSEVIFAIFSINYDQENTILTSASKTIQMVNGTNSVEMTSTLNERRDENGYLSLEFSTDNKNQFTEGHYSGKQIAEIIYL